jgi:protein TonB
MSATSAGGGVAVPVTEGPTAARGTPGLPDSVPAGNNAGPTAVAADATEVETGPSVLRQPSAVELRALYPDEARKAGVEADVRVELLVSETGAVSAVRLLDGAGQGFDEVAVRAARLIAFRPARRGGRPVAIRLPWTLKFRLDG